MSAISGPIAPYSNVPIQPQFYLPSRFVISDVELGKTTTVTMTEDHNYVIGQQVRLLIPPTFGCRQLNEQTGYVISIPADDQVELDIYSSGGDEFTSSSATTKPQILAIGDINLGATNSQGRINNGLFIPGSFIDVSPA
jgi:hypothetical protein